MIFQDDIRIVDTLSEKSRDGESFYRSVGFRCREERSSVIGRSASYGIGKNDEDESNGYDGWESGPYLSSYVPKKLRNEEYDESSEEGQWKERITPDPIGGNTEKYETRFEGHDKEDAGPSDEDSGGISVGR